MTYFLALWWEVSSARKTSAERQARGELGKPHSSPGEAVPASSPGSSERLNCSIASSCPCNRLGNILLNLMGLCSLPVPAISWRPPSMFPARTHNRYSMPGYSTNHPSPPLTSPPLPPPKVTDHRVSALGVCVFIMFPTKRMNPSEGPDWGFCSFSVPLCHLAPYQKHYRFSRNVSWHVLLWQKAAFSERLKRWCG